jgi:hypothetical protein
MPLLFDYATLEAAWDLYPTERVRYAPDETGWALRLDPDHVLIANVPMADNLFMLDVCECPRRRALPQVGRVIQRYYTQRALVRYVPLDDQEELLRRYRLLAAVVKARDCASEGMVPGYVQVQARAGCDLEAVITAAAAEAGLELLGVEVAAAEDEAEDEE